MAGRLDLNLKEIHDQYDISFGDNAAEVAEELAKVLGKDTAKRIVDTMRSAYVAGFVRGANHERGRK